MIVLALLACGPELYVYERPIVVASAREIDFGWVSEGDVAHGEITLRNDGDLPFGVDSVEQLGPESALGGGFWVETAAPGTLVEAGEELALDVWFTPEASRVEDALVVRFFEDDETAWFDRAHPRMGFRLSGNGIGREPAEFFQPIVGGVIPREVGLEIGDSTVITAHTTGGAESSWDVREEDGSFGASDASEAVYTAPDALPCEAERLCPTLVSWMGRTPEGNMAWDFVELDVWAEGKLREPVVLDEPR